MTPGPTATLAAWCAETPGDWSQACRTGARRAIQDTLATMLAGHAEASVSTTRRAVARWGGGLCFAAGGGDGMTAPWAALVNGTAAHALDYDDVLDPAMSHPSAALLPALLTLAETTGADGAGVLDAYLVGFEVMARLGEAMNLSHYQRGWHTTLSLGSPGVAAACGRLLGLDRHRMTMALGLATSMAGGSKGQFGTMAKPLHAGLAAKNGLLAATLAEAGTEASAEPFEGHWGYVEMMAGPQATGLGAVLAGLGRPAAMEQYGVWLKAYPCCASTHRPIDALRSLAPPQETIARIEVLVSEVAAANLRYRVPRTPSEARFSLPYCLAATVADGAPSIASFSEKAIARPALRHVMEATEMRPDPELPGDVAVRGTAERAILVLHRTDGSSERIVRTVPHGHPGDPLSEAELDAKFLDCTREALSPRLATEVLSLLHRFEMPGSITAITSLLREAAGAVGSRTRSRAPAAAGG